MDITTLSSQVERISQIYAKRFGIVRNKQWFVMKLQEEMGELIQAYLMLSGQARKKDKHEGELLVGFEHEVADVLCHVLLVARHFDIDLEKVVTDKWLKWNKKDEGNTSHS